MGQKEIELKLPTNYSQALIEKEIAKQVNLKDISYKIIRKSLDCRRKDKIHWLIKLRISSNEIKNGPLLKESSLQIPHIKTAKKVLIVGTGPASIFAGIYLINAGFKVSIIEKGKPVDQRAKELELFEKEGIFSPISNYSFGEGGAGTFSDGKLTSRSKHIKKERAYILESFVQFGAPEEILYLTHPHIGSDNLIKIAQNMRQHFLERGGEIFFETELISIESHKSKVHQGITNKGSIEADYFILGTGHSSFKTFKMLIDNHVPYKTKNFAIGFRMEHKQELINTIQWGASSLSGVKAAEYRLTSSQAHCPVYTFCMCPGGKIVPATAYEHQNIVNGMSLYQRDGHFANAAIVAGVSPALIEEQIKKTPTPLDSLNWLETLEESFYSVTGSYKAPSMTIKDFLNNDPTQQSYPTSYPLGLYPTNLKDLMPPPITQALQTGLKDFTKRLEGFEEGQLIGLESKTSSPIQVLRHRESTLVEGFSNLFICGEASGWAGGIISSASDGLKAAISLTKSLI